MQSLDSHLVLSHAACRGFKHGHISMLACTLVTWDHIDNQRTQEVSLSHMVCPAGACMSSSASLTWRDRAALPHNSISKQLPTLKSLSSASISMLPSQHDSTCTCMPLAPTPLALRRDTTSWTSQHVGYKFLSLQFLHLQQLSSRAIPWPCRATTQHDCISRHTSTLSLTSISVDMPLPPTQLAMFREIVSWTSQHAGYTSDSQALQCFSTLQVGTLKPHEVQVSENPSHQRLTGPRSHQNRQHCSPDYVSLCQRLLTLFMLAGFLDRGSSWAFFSCFCPLYPPCLFSSGLTLTFSRLFPPLVCVCASRESRERRPSPTRGHSTTRLLHPARATRIGEATHPGPPSSSTSSTTTSDSDDDPPSASATSAAGDASDTIAHVQINVRMSTGRPATLKCHWLPKFGSWKWSTSRYAHQGKGPPSTILREWATRFAGELHPDGRREIESVLAIHPDPPVGPPGSLSSAGPVPSSAPISFGPPPAAPTRPATTVSFSPPPTARDLPPPEALERCRSLFFWLGQAIPTQRTIPKTGLNAVDQVCAHLLQLLHDPALPATHRRVLLALAATLPRWLWPEPGRRDQPLPANARPQLLKERSQAFLANDWTLLLHTLSNDTEPAEPSPSAPRTPGLLTADDHARLLRAAKQGRLTVAWRQLYSYGVAAATEATQTLLQQKWLPAPAFPTERRGHYLTPADAHELLSHERLLRATRSLPHGSATDVLGWTHETWQSLHQLPHGLKLQRELLVLYATGELGREATDLLNASLAIPLRKNTAGTSLRPIAVPTAFRKVYARVCVARFRTELQEASGPYQYAAMQADGCRSIASTLRASRTPGMPPRLFLRTDIHNAFNQADRQTTLDSLSSAHPLLQASQYSWLRNPSHAFMPAWRGGRRHLTTDLGIPQGDPLSSLAFTLLLAAPLQSVNSDSVTAVAYADDVVLLANAADMEAALSKWQSLLAPLGLTLSLDKLQLWNPDGLPVPSSFLEAYPNLCHCEQGFRICGLPLDKLDAQDPLADTPFGNDSFTHAFLQDSREALRQRLRVLATFVHHHGPHTEALHVATHILRVNLAARCVHLYRFCPRDIMHEWTAHITADIHDWLHVLVGITTATPHAQLVLHVPTAMGGLGIPHPQHEAALHFLQVSLPIVAELSPAEREQNKIWPDTQHAFEFLNRIAGCDLRRELEHTLPHRQGHKLREAFHDALARLMRETCPWLQLTGLPVSTDADISWRWQVKVMMTWYTASPGTFLHAGPFRLAMAQHLGLPIFHPGQRCRYTPLTTGKACGQQLGSHSTHACTCAQGPSIRRHNRLRDQWVTLCRRAGWHTTAEQTVRTGETDTKRADLVALTPEGLRLAADVMITAPPVASAPHGDHLHRSELAKATAYHTTPWSRLPDGCTLVPLVHDGLVPWLAPSALRFLHRLAATVARQSAPDAPSAWGAHFHAVTVSLAAPLLHTACTASWQLHAACGELL